MNRLAITRLERAGKKYIAYILLNEKREFVDFQLFLDKEDRILNSIYIGRVENIVANINAAFIRISKDCKCFLNIKDLKNPIFTKRLTTKNNISIGDEILVQVVKDAVKTKDPVVDTKLTLQGKYCVLTTHQLEHSISKKIGGEERKLLKSNLEEFFEKKGSPDYGIILRTNVSGLPWEVISEDIQELEATYKAIMEKASHGQSGVKYYEDPPEYAKKLKSMALENIDGIFTDQEDILDNIKDHVPKANDKLHFYQDDYVSLKTLYHIEGRVDELLSKKVWLKSGANIIIEQLETLTFIDVNTGKNLAKNSKMMLTVNKEAAKEIVRQIRFRNISGMILVDFINMDEDDQNELIAYVKNEIKNDTCKLKYMDYTKLGLMEFTRKKEHASLRELVEEN